jgi:hypothetical protein
MNKVRKVVSAPQQHTSVKPQLRDSGQAEHAICLNKLKLIMLRGVAQIMRLVACRKMMNQSRYAGGFGHLLDLLWCDNNDLKLQLHVQQIDAASDALQTAAHNKACCPLMSILRMLIASSRCAASKRKCMRSCMINYSESGQKSE